VSPPEVEVPPVSEALPQNPPQAPAKKGNVCALGHKYGGWGKDTPQAVICKDVYGH
jgi:hypothetical protein